MKSAPDLFAAQLAAPADALAGLVQLERGAPLWPAAPGRWRDQIEAAKAFARRWDDPARRSGWSVLGLWGVHPAAPDLRFDCLGAAWMIARATHAVLAIDPRRIELRTRTGALCALYRMPDNRAAIVAWTLRGSA
jgi:hypothetical protein